jgi:hypothetical protein
VSGVSAAAGVVVAVVAVVAVAAVAAAAAAGVVVDDDDDAAAAGAALAAASAAAAPPSAILCVVGAGCTRDRDVEGGGDVCLPRRDRRRMCSAVRGTAWTRIAPSDWQCRCVERIISMVA